MPPTHTSPPNAFSQKLLDAAKELSNGVAALRFSAPVTHVYNPLDYAWAPHEIYLRRFGNSRKKVVFLGMNPGPFGMAQCGVPFGEIAAVRDWMGISAPVSKPENENPKQPVKGFECPRSEVSGRRLWGLFKNAFGTADAFFSDHFVANYCPLAFFNGGKNVTPDKLRPSETTALTALCDAHLRKIVETLDPEWVIGVGAFAEARAKAALSETNAGKPPRIGKILHPSPANPAANRDWPDKPIQQLVELGVWRQGNHLWEIVLLPEPNPGVFSFSTGAQVMDDQEDEPRYIAHIKPGTTPGKSIFHPLPEHGLGVSKISAGFAAEFGARTWAEWAALWHDLGKFREGFERYIRQNADPNAHIETKVTGREKTHSAAGALWAQEYLPKIDARSGPAIAKVLSYLIAGHHTGLDDSERLTARFEQGDTKKEYRDALAAAIPDSLLKPTLPLPDIGTVKNDAEIPGRFALWVRMLFSCLVDADFLDTEAFMSPDKAAARSTFMSLEEMEKRLTAHLDAKAKKIEGEGKSGTLVNLARARVLSACRAKSELAPGVFSLTVPTGGGKTLSSLAFALRHALCHKKRRVVYAIPYTSIIEQTAEIYQGIFGDENVIEHHSNVEVEEAKENHRTRLSAENWDAPLIVTTNVQLFESLFARKTSRCRKLHNLANSVIVLDEAQLLPLPYLQVIVDALRLLVQDYGVTVVLCTATQPSLETRVSFDLAHALKGFKSGEVREIIDDVPGLYADLKRVSIHLPKQLGQPSSWEEIAPEIAAHDAVLAVVNRRADARALYREIKALDVEVWHLSGLMCAQHRSDVIKHIKKALDEHYLALSEGKQPKPVRLVSTQLIEAGVDLDFPVVYRAVAGLDSIAQASGRCNREGRLPQGHVYLFEAPHRSPKGLLLMAEGKARILLQELPTGAEPLEVERFSEYFQQLYADADLDSKGIRELSRVGKKGEISFRQIAEKFRLIDEKNSATVFVRYHENSEDKKIDTLLGKLKKDGPDRWLMRKLQRYGVTLYQSDIDRLVSLGDIEALPGDCSGLYAQSEKNDFFYDPNLGANVDGAPGEPSLFVQ
ncbi:MAG: CRISPR-associated helicase Cas3' [Candidatus Accumulibacter sp.]|nr:CRISPR-associated helicase Cas3' [Accumulibacter sp.]